MKILKFYFCIIVLLFAKHWCVVSANMYRHDVTYRKISTITRIILTPKTARLRKGCVFYMWTNLNKNFPYYRSTPQNPPDLQKKSNR